MSLFQRQFFTLGYVGATVDCVRIIEVSLFQRFLIARLHCIMSIEFYLLAILLTMRVCCLSAVCVSTITIYNPCNPSCGLRQCSSYDGHTGLLDKQSLYCIVSLAPNLGRPLKVARCYCQRGSEGYIIFIYSLFSHSSALMVARCYCQLGSQG